MGIVVDSGTSMGRLAERWFSATPDAPGLVRQLVRDMTDRWPSDTVQCVEVLASELATNAVVHGRTPFLVRLLAAGEMIRVDVVDRGGGYPCVQHPGLGDVRGRGLWMVDQAASRWGIELEGSATTVWFEVEAQPVEAVVLIPLVATSESDTFDS